MEIDRLLQKQQLNVQKSALVCPAKSTRPRLKSLLLAEACGLGFYVAASQKGVLTSQWSGSLGRPTFSTESAGSSLSRMLDTWYPSGQVIYPAPQGQDIVCT